MQSSAYPFSLTVEELARRVEGSFEGNGSALIMGVSSIDEAEFGDIVFAEDSRRLKDAIRSRASAIVAFIDAITPDKPLIRVENPRYAFVKILKMFESRLNAPVGIHPTAVVGKNARISEDASIGPNAVIGDDVCVGSGSVILAGCVVGDECTIGEQTVLHANVTLYPTVEVGNRVIIHSGTVIGADGFGYMRIGDRSVKVPQIGSVQIGDDAEIGANCTVDRAKTGATVIGARCKIDDLVHIAHNVKLGTDCIIIAQVGIAGSVQIGCGVIMAGQSGVKDHVTIGDGATILARAGVIGNIDPGSYSSGFPARPHGERLRIDAALARLPEHVKRMRSLEKSNRELIEQNERLSKIVEVLAERAGISIESPDDK